MWRVLRSLEQSALSSTARVRIVLASLSRSPGFVFFLFETVWAVPGGGCRHRPGTPLAALRTEIAFAFHRGLRAGFLSGSGEVLRHRDVSNPSITGPRGHVCRSSSTVRRHCFFATTMAWISRRGRLTVWPSILPSRPPRVLRAERSPSEVLPIADGGPPGQRFTGACPSRAAGTGTCFQDQAPQRATRSGPNEERIPPGRSQGPRDRSGSRN